MLKNIRQYILNFFKGHERSVKAKKNIVASTLIKGMSMIIGFLIIKITYTYLNQTVYGIWLTLTSFLTWFSFFEIGLGNGLRNKLAEALAVKDYKLGKAYVSTTYAILGVVMSILAIAFFIGNNFLDWTVILNTKKELGDELTYLSFIVFGFFFMRFVLQLISVVLSADQRPAVANAFGPIGNFVVLILIYILTLTTEGSLIYLGWVLSVMPFLVLLIATIYFFSTDYKKIAPSLSYVKFKYAKDLLSLGVKFFAIQIAGLIIYQSSVFIIAQYFGSAEVTIYYAAYTYFSILTMAFTIIVTPFWSAYTEAWVKQDIQWIKNTVSKLLKIWVLLSAGGVLMLFVATPFYSFLFKGLEVPFNLSLVFLIYFVTFTFGNIFNMFINGVGKIKLQLILASISAVIFILVAILLIEVFHLGSISLVIASIIANIEGFVIAPIQYNKIINNRANGIWNQ